jgi:hypothetical protein
MTGKAHRTIQNQFGTMNHHKLKPSGKACFARELRQTLPQHWLSLLCSSDAPHDFSLVYAVDLSGAVESFALGIYPEDFEIIPSNVANQNLYCVQPDPGAILKLSGTLLTNYVGDLLITDAGEKSPAGKLFIAHWNGANFEIRSIAHPAANRFEHVTFAPINLPPSTP